MKSFVSQRVLQVFAGILCFLLGLLLGSAWYFGIWSWQDLRVYQGMSRECHPVWKDLHWGRVHAGQDVEEVIVLTKPVRVERYGEFVRLNYQQGLCFTGVTITARRGRLVSACAWSCTWDKTFFDEMSPEEWEQFSQVYEAHWKSRHNKE